MENYNHCISFGSNLRNPGRISRRANKRAEVEAKLANGEIPLINKKGSKYFVLSDGRIFNLSPK
jgi:hypothetical protein